VVIASKIPPKTFRWPVRPGEPLSTTFPAPDHCPGREIAPNLGSDYVDVMQLHAWTDDYVGLDEWLEAFRRLKEQGKVRFGVSMNDWELRRRQTGCLRAGRQHPGYL
jgi:hypothetical protein